MPPPAPQEDLHLGNHENCRTMMSQAFSVHIAAIQEQHYDKVFNRAPPGLHAATFLFLAVSNMLGDLSSTFLLKAMPTPRGKSYYLVQWKSWQEQLFAPA